MAILQLQLQISQKQKSTNKNISYALLLILLSHHRVTSDNFCGNALAGPQCWQPCSADSDCCLSDQKCFDASSSCGTSDLSGDDHKYCGSTWCDAAYLCGTPCPEGTECGEGESCFADLPCGSGATPPPPQEVTGLNNNNNPAGIGNYCGTTWEDANSKCGTQCPNLDECGEGESCFAQACGSDAPTPVTPTAAPTQFCGGTLEEAKNSCWQPCPKGDSDCCSGLKCFDTATDAPSGETCTPNDSSGSNHFFCGSTWCDAAYSCTTACPGGTNEECPGGSYCYADIPCTFTGDAAPAPAVVVPPPVVDAPPSSLSKYCGTSAEHAAATCWQPCRDDSDCCFGQTCYSDVTECGYPDVIGNDRFFCGEDFCGASFQCTKPCPSGYDAECAIGQSCFVNTPCNSNVKRSMTGDILDYGLPRSASNLMRQYRPDQYPPESDSGLKEPINAAYDSPFSGRLVKLFPFLLGVFIFFLKS